MEKYVHLSSISNGSVGLVFKDKLKAYKITGFPGSSAGKESACNAGDPGLIPGLGRSPGEGIGYPLQYSCLEKPHGQRSLVGYTSWSRKESDMTEQLSKAQRKYKVTI